MRFCRRDTAPDFCASEEGLAKCTRYSLRQIVRNLFTVLSVLGLIAAFSVYMASFAGLTMEWLGMGVFILHGGIFLIAIPLAVVQRVSFSGEVREDSYAPETKPAWASRGLNFCGLFFFLNFVAFLWMSHAASPEIVDSNFVLSDHGHIVRSLTSAEYWRLKAAELRLFAAGWIAFYFYATTSWHFLRRRLG